LFAIIITIKELKMSTLIEGQRYLFIVKKQYSHIIDSFYANFMDIINNTLRVKKWNDGSENSVTTLPLEWIEKTEIITDTDLAYIKDIHIALEDTGFI